MKFTKIPSNTFQKLQINAGILTTDFTPATGTIGEAGQIGATTGGVNFTARLWGGYRQLPEEYEGAEKARFVGSEDVRHLRQRRYRHRKTAVRRGGHRDVRHDQGHTAQRPQGR